MFSLITCPCGAIKQIKQIWVMIDVGHHQMLLDVSREPSSSLKRPRRRLVSVVKVVLSRPRRRKSEGEGEAESQIRAFILMSKMFMCRQTGNLWYILIEKGREKKG